MKPLGLFAMVASDLYSNRKIRKAGAFGAQVFTFALLKNAEHGRAGSFPASELEEWYLADRLMLTEAQAAEGLTRAIAAGLVDVRDDIAVIVGWDETWARRTLTESEARVLRRKKQNEIQKQKERERGPGETRTESGQCPDNAGQAEPEVEPRPHELRALELANIAVQGINAAAGTKYQPDSAETLKNCRALAKANVTPEEVRAVVAAKWKEWGTSDRMLASFRPSTLLRPGNFRRYREDLTAGAKARSSGYAPSRNITDESSVSGRAAFASFGGPR